MIIGSFTPTLVLPPQGGGYVKSQSFTQGRGYERIANPILKGEGNDRNKSILQEGGNEKE